MIDYDNFQNKLTETAEDIYDNFLIQCKKENKNRLPACAYINYFKKENNNFTLCRIPLDLSEAKVNIEKINEMHSSKHRNYFCFLNTKLGRELYEKFLKNS